MLRTEAAKAFLNLRKVSKQGAHINTATVLRPFYKFRARAFGQQKRPRIIPILDMQICHSYLQNALVQHADGSALGAPGIFQFFMRFEKFPGVEQFQSVNGGRG